MIQGKGLNRSVVALGIGMVVACASAPTMASERATNVVCSGCVGTSDLASGAVTAPKLRDQAVTTAKLRNKAVNRAKLKNNTVNSAKIQDGTVSNADLANFSVSESKIQVGAVNGGHIQVDAVTRSNIADNTIHDNDIEDEPGVDFNSSTASVTLTSTEQTVRSIVLTAPADGFVTCMDNSQITFGVADSDGGVFFGWERDGINDSSKTWWDNVNNGLGDDFPVSSHKTFAVTPGVHTFELQARTSLTSVTFRTYDATCMYFPTRY